MWERKCGGRESGDREREWLRGRKGERWVTKDRWNEYIWCLQIETLSYIYLLKKTVFKKLIPLKSLLNLRCHEQIFKISFLFSCCQQFSSSGIYNQHCFYHETHTSLTPPPSAPPWPTSVSTWQASSHVIASSVVYRQHCMVYRLQSLILLWETW